MQRLKFFLMLVASVMLLACSGGEDSTGGGNNNGGETPDKPNPETPVTTETLPEGVEIGEETQQLNNIQLGHIETVDEDNSTLTFSSELPAEHIPQKGQILLQYSATEDLPYGFLGRVTNVTTVGNNIIVETEAPALDEAFDKLVINYDMTDAAIQTRTESETEDSIDFDEDHFLRFTRRLTLGKEVSCELSLGIRISTSTHIDNEKNIDNQQYEIGLKAGAELNYKYELEGEKSITRDLGKGINFRLPYVSPAIMGVIKFSWVSEASGNLNFNSTLTSSVSRFYQVNKIGNNISTSEGEGITTPSMKLEFEPEIKFEGEMFFGLGVNIELRLFGRNELAIGVGSKIGPRVSTEVDLLADEDNLYEQYKDTAIELNGIVQSTAFAQAKLFNVEAEWSKPFGEGWVFWDATRYIFPSFKNSKLDYADNKVDCSVELDRNILFKGKVGINQYKKEEVVSQSEPVEYYNSEDFQNPLTGNFDHMDMDSLYYYTYVKWGSKIIKCKQLQDDIVGTWKCVIEEIWEHGHYYIDTYSTDYWGFRFDASGEGVYFEHWNGITEEWPINWELSDNKLTIIEGGYNDPDCHYDTFTVNILSTQVVLIHSGIEDYYGPWWERWIFSKIE